jgi:hypothetical protein
LREIVGKREVWRSLGTDSATVARRRFHQVAAEIERDFEAARWRVGLAVDQAILSGPSQQEAPAMKVSDAVSGPFRDAEGPTLRQVYDAYMADPTRDWSPRTRFAYETTRRVVMAVLGEGTPIRSITRAQCRDLIETLRWLPFGDFLSLVRPVHRQSGSKFEQDVFPQFSAHLSRRFAGSSGGSGYRARAWRVVHKR